MPHFSTIPLISIDVSDNESLNESDAVDHT